MSEMLLDVEMADRMDETMVIVMGHELAIVLKLVSTLAGLLYRSDAADE